MLKPSICFAGTRIWCSPRWEIRVFCRRLPQGRVKPALALSLHTTDAALRAPRGCCPQAPRVTPEELVEQGEVYARATGYPISKSMDPAGAWI